MTQVEIRPKSAKNLEILLKSAVENQLSLLDFGIGKTKRNLEELESQFGMDTATFYEKYNEGKLGDEGHYLRWAGEYETLGQLQKDYDELKDLELCS